MASGVLYQDWVRQDLRIFSADVRDFVALGVGTWSVGFILDSTF